MHDKWWFGAEGHWSAGVKMWHLKCHTGSFHFLTAVKARRFQTLKVENLWAVFFFSSLEWFWPPDKMLYFKRIFSGCKHWTEELPSLASCSKTLQHVMCLQGRNQDCRSTEVMSPLPPPHTYPPGKFTSLYVEMLFPCHCWIISFFLDVLKVKF